MKRLFFLCAFIVLTAFNVFSDNEKPVPYAELPQPIKQFVDEHFHQIPFLGATYDETDQEYEVKLELGTKLEFNKKGEWTSVWCPKHNVCHQLLPEKIIQDFIDRAHRETIIEVKKGKKEYELKTLSGKEYHYTLNGKFVKMEKD